MSPSPTRVLVVDDDMLLGQALRRVLSQMGLEVEVATDGETALARIEADAYDVMVLDLKMRGMDGLSVLRAARRSARAPATILHSAYLDVPTAVSAMREGASEILEKPVAASVLADRIRDLARARGAVHALGWTQSAPAPDARPALERLVGHSAAVRSLRQQIKKVAAFHEVPVLVEGPTGSGKELVARAIHETGSPEEPFVVINCAAAPEQQFERELFGEEVGPGARGDRPGLLERAGGGALFLDDVGELPASLQPKLLGVLETREFRPLGSSAVRRFRARIISSTSTSLSSQGSAFKRELYFRLAGYTITTPSLGERTEDVPELTRCFLAAFSERYPASAARLDDEAISALTEYYWPGNVRELRSVVENAAILSSGGVVTAADVESALKTRRVAVRAGEAVAPPSSDQGLAGTAAPSLPELERSVILEAYEVSGKNLSRAARRLGIPRSTLRDRLRKFGVR